MSPSSQSACCVTHVGPQYLHSHCWVLVCSSTSCTGRWQLATPCQVIFIYDCIFVALCNSSCKGRLNLQYNQIKKRWSYSGWHHLIQRAATLPLRCMSTAPTTKACCLSASCTRLTKLFEVLHNKKYEYGHYEKCTIYKNSNDITATKTFLWQLYHIFTGTLTSVASP